MEPHKKEVHTVVRLKVTKESENFVEESPSLTAVAPSSPTH